MRAQAMETQPDESRRPRAPKACLSCHTRKVRCDALQVGVPCTKCKLNRFECSTKDRKKRRKKADLLKPSTAPTSQRPIPEHTMLHQVPHYPFFRFFQSSGQPWLQAKDKEDGVLLPVPGYDQSTSSNAAKSTLSVDDLEFLSRKGAFQLPSRGSLDKCVSAYFQIFHPFFPIIDKPAFLDQYRRSDQDSLVHGRGISLLLLQAILFTASSYLSNDIINEMGFSSKKQARRTLYMRALYLHKLDFEPNDIVAIQALLLLSHHYPSMVEQRHTWFWVHQAIGLAQGTGLHRDPGDVPQRKLWARIWWACLVRDRLISLGTGRPMHINSLDCSVRPLTMADLDEDADSDEDRAIKATFIQFVKLCQYMEGVLSLPLVPADSLAKQARVCDSTLQQWFSNLSTDTLFSGSADKRNILKLYQTLTLLIYNVVVISLLRFENEVRGNQPESQLLGSERYQLCAVSSVNLLKELMSRDLVQLCPTQCVTSVLPPLIIHLTLMRCARTTPDYAVSKANFQACMSFLERLGEVYWHASFYHDFLKLAASHVSAKAQPRDNLEIPREESATVSKNDDQRLSEMENGIENPPRCVDGQVSSLGWPLPTFENAGNSAFMVPESVFDLISSDSHSIGRFDSAHFLNLLGGDIQTFGEWLDQDRTFQSFFPSA